MKLTQTFTNLFILIGLSIVVYFIFVYLKIGAVEGMDTLDSSGNKISTSSSINVTDGIAGNAANYEAAVQAKVIQSQDMLLISKYRTDYENTILKIDDLLNNLMLQAALNVNLSNPTPDLMKLSTLNNTKQALNSIIKFIDSSH